MAARLRDKVCSFDGYNEQPLLLLLRLTKLDWLAISFI
jgi:hypothetical protein